MLTFPRILSEIFLLDTRAVEVWAAISLVVLGIYSMHEPLPPNMIEFQFQSLWTLELVPLGIMHVYAAIRYPKSFLRTWLLLIQSLFWFYYSVSSVDVYSPVVTITTGIISASLAVGFLQRGTNWDSRI